MKLPRLRHLLKVVVRARHYANWRGATFYPPGHFYSPLLELDPASADATLGFDGADGWEHVALRAAEQRAFFEELVAQSTAIELPRRAVAGRRYYSENEFFVYSDALLLRGVLERLRPRRVIEVGSGFSSAVMLDAAEALCGVTNFTFVEPYPDRLRRLLGPGDLARVRLIEKRVQEVDVNEFAELRAGDVLFIDSSHVAKVGSDVAHLLLRVLPRLKPGVWVHVHDIFHPFSYPPAWLQQGRAWNESLFLRAFLIGNADFAVRAFNSFAGHSFPELFAEKCPRFLEDTGGSFWMEKVR